MTRNKNTILSRFSVVNHSNFEVIDDLVNVSVPLKKGALPSTAIKGSLEIRSLHNEEFECDYRPLSFWPDGSAKWAMLTFICSLQPNQEKTFELVDFAEASYGEQDLTIQQDGALPAYFIDSAARCLNFCIGSKKIALKVETQHTTGLHSAVEWGRHEVVFDGKITTEYLFDGTLSSVKRCKVKLYITVSKKNQGVKIKFRIHNEAAAVHEGGFWGLGDQNSIYFDYISLSFNQISNDQQRIAYSLDAGETQNAIKPSTLTIHQHSSGGNFWDCKTHKDLSGEVPLLIKGFTAKIQGVESRGLRADPIISLQTKDSTLTAAIPDFWQKFPCEISADAAGMVWGILPKTSYRHELQPGEALSREIILSARSITSQRSAFAPLIVKIDPEISDAAKAVDWSVTNLLMDSNHQLYFDAMLEGQQSFFSKRELIDEYGWRNYGDVWADHEVPYADEPGPIISHYNNQYDLLNGVLRASLSSGDPRWSKIAVPLARHILDIDRYQTSEDKAGFNGGLFWHTAHYRDAHTSSHRGYCTSMKVGKHSVPGGGPGSNEQNYTTGLKLYFELTGDPVAKSAVLEMADWVIAMDDGDRSMFAPFSALPTGKASSTAQANYHGPGRGAGNSINCLLDAWQLSYNQSYLDKCNQLIKRVVHPNDEIAKLDLLNAELRWSYTVCLQSLIKYLLVVDEPVMREYILAVLRHYGQWMQTHEKPYFDNIAALEFPTETWHAQDLRKGNMMIAISQLFPKQSFSKGLATRGKQIQAFAWQSLIASPTKFFSRPCALVLQQLPIQSMLESEALTSRHFEYDAKSASPKFGQPTQFTSQRSYVMSSAKRPLRLLGMLARSAWLPRWNPTIRQIKPIKQLRKLLRLN